MRGKKKKKQLKIIFIISISINAKFDYQYYAFRSSIEAVFCVKATKANLFIFYIYIHKLQYISGAARKSAVWFFLRSISKYSSFTVGHCHFPQFSIFASQVSYSFFSSENEMRKANRTLGQRRYNSKQIKKYYNSNFFKNIMICDQ